MPTANDLATDFYAPTFQVEVEGQALDPLTLGDVLEVRVEMDLEHLSSCDLTINNWDDRKIDFKYSDKPTFDVCNKVHVQLGYADRLVSMLHGRITSLTPNFPASGTPTLRVRCLDSMFLLRDSRPDDGEPKQYRKKSASEIARIKAGQYGLTPNIPGGDPPLDLVVQKNQDDAQYLKRLAVRGDSECFIETDAAGRESLYFGKPRDGRDATRIKVYVFEWGESRAAAAPLGGSTERVERHLLHGLLSFSPRLSVARQVSQLTVRGWNSETKDVFSYTAGADDLARENGNPGASGPQTVERLPGRRKKEVVLDFRVESQEEARQLARSLIQERANEFITGTGEVIGLRSRDRAPRGGSPARTRPHRRHLEHRTKSVSQWR